ncbi:MAG: hypothetical protein HYS23_08855 [Geobacter sp.]|nr:hypothetical protein [Geobacter sp.]
MSIFDKIRNIPFMDMIKDQRLKELLLKREFRLSEDYLQREFLRKAEDDEVSNLILKLENGFGTLSGKVKKRLLPFAVPFSARFAIHAVDFSRSGKVVLFKMEEIKPIDSDWLTQKLVRNVPFLAYADRILVCDLERVPRLTELFSYQVKGVRPLDHVVLKELSFCEGEVVGRLGLCL